MKIKVILIGAGNRGAAYTDIMGQMTDKYEVVAVAEPIESRIGKNCRCCNNCNNG